MADTLREIEAKYDVAPDFTLGSLSDLVLHGDRLTTSTSELVSSYYDTPSADLLRSRITLRRRTGTDDTGWHLKIPGDGFRTEMRWELGDDDAPPEELSTLIMPFTHAVDVTRSVQLRVIRTRHRLIAPDGSLRFEIADDEVRADGLGVRVRTPRWREIEVELGPGGQQPDLWRAAALLSARGAFPSASQSKLDRALHGIRPSEQSPDTAGGALLGYLRAQCDGFTTGHFAISLKPFEPLPTVAPHEAVHQTRVTTRRLRAALRTFAPLFETDRAAQLEAELKWFAAELGEVRDREVLRARLARAVDDLPAYLIVGPVAERIDEVLLGELRQHAAALLQTMSDWRYHALVDDLADWRAAPPYTPAAARPARTLGEMVAAAERKLAKKMKRARSRQADEADMHSARKAGKRARYAAEAAAPVLGKSASSLARTAANLQSLLGEHQDSIVATELLRRIADQVADEGQNAFTYGILVADQRRSAADSARAAREATSS